MDYTSIVRGIQIDRTSIDVDDLVKRGGKVDGEIIVQNDEVILKKGSDSYFIDFIGMSWLKESHVEAMKTFVNTYFDRNGYKPYWYAVLTGSYSKTMNMNCTLSSDMKSTMNLEIVLERLEQIRNQLHSAGIEKLTAEAQDLLLNEISGTRFAFSIDSELLSSHARSILDSYKSRPSSTLVDIVKFVFPYSSEDVKRKALINASISADCTAYVLMQAIARRDAKIGLGIGEFLFDQDKLAKLTGWVAIYSGSELIEFLSVTWIFMEDLMHFEVTSKSGQWDITLRSEEEATEETWKSYVIDHMGILLLLGFIPRLEIWGKSNFTEKSHVAILAFLLPEIKSLLTCTLN